MATQKQYRDKTYRLTDDRSGESCMIKTGKKGKLTIYDEDEKVRKAIRHCPNQRTIFMEDQDKFALVEPIIFSYGYLEVSSKQPITQEFLDAHPSNVANGGGWFEAVDEETEAKESIEVEELQTDLKYTVRQMSKKEDGIHELSATASVILGSVKEATEMGVEQLKRVIYNEIDSNPHSFTDENGNITIFEDDSIKRKYIILRALSEGILRKSPNGRSMTWRDKKVIATAPRSIDLIEYFSEFLTTDEGIIVMEEIVRRS